MADSLVCWPGNCSAQTRVALVDIGLVFKNHPEFSSRLEQLRQEADQFRTSAQQTQQQLLEKAEALKQHEPGSDDFSSLESQLAKESASIEVQQRDTMRKMMNAEAQLHYDTYVEVRNVLTQFCEQNGIELVIRYNSQEMVKNDPASVMQRVNGSIVYFEPHKDITQAIIQRIAESNGTASSPNPNINR